MNSNLLTIQERANNIMKSVGCDTQDIDLIKAEGSRGGKIIGHTKSGKPIYEHSGNTKHKDFTEEEHKDAAKVHQGLSNHHAEEYKKAKLGSNSRKEHLEKVREHSQHEFIHNDRSENPENNPYGSQRDKDELASEAPKNRKKNH